MDYATSDMSRSKDAVQKALSKVPEVTIFFWVIKILCTTVGETFADFLNVNLNFGLTMTSVVTGVLLFIALYFQFRAKRYVPGIYWITVVFISVFGTLVTDNLTDKIGVPLEVSTIVFSIALAGVFAAWYWYEKTLSIHSIFTTRREAFYWLTILCTFALGTASGDLMAEGLGLGYLTTGLIVAGVIAVTTVARKLGLNSVLAFWIVYIMTRPLGASIGDYLSQAPHNGGLGLGTTGTSALFLVGILATVSYLTISKKDTVAKVGETKNERGGVWQTAATVAIAVIVSGTAYAWRHSSLQADTTDTSSGGTAAMASSGLGDLSQFRTITQDTKTYVQANDFTKAKTRITDLETLWDTSQATLKPKDKAKWTEIDDAIDAALRQVRSVKPDQQKTVSALDDLLSTLQ